MALNFDLSSIPLNLEINNAELFLYNKAYVIEGLYNPPCSLFTIEKEWVETEFSWNNAKADLPWENIDNSSQMLGGGDHSVEPVSVSQSNGINKWLSFEITELVKEMVSGNSIYGLLFKEVLNGSEKDFSEGCSFASSEADEIELRPKLVIEYNNTDITKKAITWVNKLTIKEISNTLILNGFNNNSSEVSLYSLSGKLVNNFAIVNRSVIIDKNEFSKGTYFLKLNGEGAGTYKIFMK